MHSLCKRSYGVLIVALITATVLSADKEASPLIPSQNDSTQAVDGQRKTTWEKSVGRTVWCQGVFREVSKGYYDTLMLNNTSLVIVWKKGDPRPEDGTPVEMQGKLVSVTYGGGPPNSQRQPDVARAYGIQDVTWTEIHRIKKPYLTLVE